MTYQPFQRAEKKLLLEIELRGGGKPEECEYFFIFYVQSLQLYVYKPFTDQS